MTISFCLLNMDLSPKNGRNILFAIGSMAKYIASKQAVVCWIFTFLFQIIFPLIPSERQTVSTLLKSYPCIVLLYKCSKQISYSNKIWDITKTYFLQLLQILLLFQ